VGDFVLMDHPRLKKGLSRGIAHKYYGPFEIKKIDSNNVDYLIQRAGVLNGKIYKIHQNRLKFYHADNNKRDEIEHKMLSNDDNEVVKKKRKYTLDKNNPRWKKTKRDSETESRESSINSQISRNETLNYDFEQKSVKTTKIQSTSCISSKKQSVKVNKCKKTSIEYSNKHQQFNSQVNPERLKKPNSHIHQTKVINQKKRGRPKKDQDIKSYTKKQHETNNTKTMDNTATTENKNSQLINNRKTYNLRQRKVKPVNQLQFINLVEKDNDYD
jgi:hypothetical protein